MKTAVSIPNDVFKRAERLARRTNRTRSKLFSDALGEYLDRHDADEITQAMDAVIDEVGDLRDPFVRAAAQRTLERIDW